MGKHPGITKLIQECRSKYYYPGLAKKIKQWVMQCEDCIKYKRINKSQIRPKTDQQYRTRLGTGRHTRNRHTAEPTKFCRIPEHCHNDRCILTLFISISNAVRHSENNWTMHCRRHDKTYLPTLILSDKGSQIRAEVVAEITQILGIQISHASTKHAQTIGILERTHASIKTALKISTGERRSMWHKYV